ncbi:MAG: hypothetical protein TU35_005125 [Thermoproteus sp. AZ2]|uniref:Uncharacterized protein n=1 Tax=Thermoproteus sp. AZ2 TaxID=1609232 RepID=A0ACC6V0M3_9CREN|nr:MAG: hypothetical protein TU35_03305 [Thermoproteus sp. AZ2]
MRIVRVKFRVYYKRRGGRLYPYIVGALTLGAWALTEEERTRVLAGEEVEKEFLLMSEEEAEREEPLYEIYTL